MKTAFLVQGQWIYTDLPWEEYWNEWAATDVDTEQKGKPIFIYKEAIGAISGWESAKPVQGNRLT